jgi:hypothetical protein
MQAGPSMDSATLLEASVEPPISIARQDGELFFPNYDAFTNNSMAIRTSERVSRTGRPVASDHLLLCL